MDRENTSHSDRELFSELIEPPIKPLHPLFINIRRPSSKSLNPQFEVELNGEALWEWRVYRQSIPRLFLALRVSMEMLLYQLNPASESRVGTIANNHVCRFYKKISKTINGNTSLKSTWHTFHLELDDIAKGPGEGITELKEKLKEAKEESQKSRIELDENAKELYAAMMSIRSLKKDGNLVNRGKNFVDVGQKQ
jgi:hypothetical protein